MADIKKMKKIKWIVRLLAGIAILALTFVIVVILVNNSAHGARDDKPYKSVVTAEAGEKFDLSSFLNDQAKNEGVTVKLSEDSHYDLSTPGNYELTLVLSSGEEAHVTLKVRDTVPATYTELPPLVVKRGSILTADMLLPEEYISDATKVTVSFLSGSVSTAKVGTYKAPLKLTDAGRNITKVENASYFVVENYDDTYYYEIGDEAPLPGDILPFAVVERWQSRDFTPRTPGFVNVFLTMAGKEYFLRYEARDTVPPQIILKDGPFNFHVGDELPDPSVFIEEIIDQTEVTVFYDQNYLFDRSELKKLTIKARDAGENVTTMTVSVAVLQSAPEGDRTGPRFSGVRDLTTEPGMIPDYLSGVTVFDSVDGEIPNDRITVDDSAVDYRTPSTGAGYEVVYSVSDSAGNETKVTINVRVVQTMLPEEELDIFFSQIIGELGNIEGQSRFTVLSSLYKLLTEKYALDKGAAHTDMSDIRREAYWGFRLGNGSCETACAMLETLLDCLSIDHIRISRNAIGTDAHSWVMVDYDVGWLYVDVLPTYGYIWTKDGRLLRENSKEAEALTQADILAREAMTQEDIDALTMLSNNAVIGWNYYKADLTDLPRAAERRENGAYTRQRYAVYYLSGNESYGTIEGLTGQSVLHGGMSQAVTAVAGKGYKFVMWSDGLTTAKRSDYVNRSATYTAIFEPDSGTFRYYDVTYLAGEGGKIVGNAEQKGILYGSYASEITAQADEMHYFICWNDGSTEETRRDIVTANTTYIALFGEKIALHYVAGENGILSCGGIDSEVGGSLTIYVKPDERGAAVTAKPQRGYVFFDWDDGKTDAVRSDAESGEKTFTARFIKDTALYTLRYTANEGGRIEGSAVQTKYCWESTTFVRAVALTGWEFVSWSDGATDPLRNDVVYGNETITALFRRVDSVTVNYIAAEGGTIEGSGLQTVGKGESTTLVKAVAKEGFVFAGWSDGMMDAERTDVPEEDALYIALFERIK